VNVFFSLQISNVSTLPAIYAISSLIPSLNSYVTTPQFQNSMHSAFLTSCDLMIRVRGLVFDNATCAVHVLTTTWLYETKLNGARLALESTDHEIRNLLELKYRVFSAQNLQDYNNMERRILNIQTSPDTSANVEFYQQTKQNLTTYLFITNSWNITNLGDPTSVYTNR